MPPPSNRDHDALIWDSTPPRTRPKPGPAAAPSTADPGPAVAPSEPPVAAQPPSVAAEDRIALRDASERYGVSVATLRRWCRSGQVDGLIVDGPSGRRWMATAHSIAERVATGQRPAGVEAATPPVPEAGAMLVPRAAWDKLMDQLGNLHEAGQQLAEARERAARFETEAHFLRERLTEVRDQRDQLRARAEAGVPPADPAPAEPATERLGDLLRTWRRRFRRPSG